MKLSFVSVLLLLSLALATPTKPKPKSSVGPNTGVVLALPWYEPPNKLRTHSKRISKNLKPVLILSPSTGVAENAPPRFKPRKLRTTRKLKPMGLKRATQQQLEALSHSSAYTDPKRKMMPKLVGDLLVMERMGTAQDIKDILSRFVATEDDSTDEKNLADLLVTSIPGVRDIISSVFEDARNMILLEAAVVKQKFLALEELISKKYKYRAFPLKHLVEIASSAMEEDRLIVWRLLDGFKKTPLNLSTAMDLAIEFKNWRTLKVIMKDARAKEHIPRILAQFSSNVCVVKAIKEIEAINESGKASVDTSPDVFHQEAEEEKICESEYSFLLDENQRMTVGN